jgi:serine/threonine-protein kinase
MSEELINALSHIDTLEVAARTSSFSFKNQNVDIGTIARKLNVAAILEGSIRRSGNTVRISAQLIDAVNGFHMWSEDFDRNLKDALVLQTDIARAVAEQLQIKLLGNEAEKIEVGGTSNPEAYVAYLHGMHLHTEKEENKGHRDRAALAAFDRAIELDANYAAAYAWRSDMLSNLLPYSPDSQFNEVRDQARVAAERSIALAPTLAVAHASLGFVRALGYRDIAGGAAEIERAQVLAPGDARMQANVAWLEMILGHSGPAVAAATRAVRLDMLNYHRHSDLVRVLYFARQYSEVLTAAQKAKAVNPEGREIENYTALSYLALGKPGLARQLCESPETPLNEEERLWILSLAYRALGETGLADSDLAKLMALPEAPGSAYLTALAYAQAGNTALALQWLETAESRHDWTSLLALRSDWMLDPIRNEPKFKAILGRMNLPP